MAWVRHAIYWVPGGALGHWGAAWLGWDVEAGRAVDQPEVAGLPRPRSELVTEPRRYGFHATLKAPFRLAEGATDEDLAAAVAGLARVLAPARAGGLRLARLGRVLALAPGGDDAELGRLAQAVVEALDGFRAPSPAAELARRRAPGLTGAQEENLRRWGYPYVADEFRFHVTLTGPLAPGEVAVVEDALVPRLAGLLAPGLVVDALAHVAEGEDGRFRLVGRHPCHGAPSS